MSETREVIVDKDNNMENFDAIDDPLENSTILHTKRFHMGSGIFIRMAGELTFHNKIQQISIDFTRLNIIKRSNRSTKEIIIIGIGEITQFGIILHHGDK